MSLKPRGDRVVVENVEQAEKTAGGVILPDTAKEKPQVGRVVAVGPGRTTDDGKLIPTGLSDGQHVLYSKYSGTEYKDPATAKEYLILPEKDILAIVERVPVGV